MFTQPTVFILGAGASWHYGYPTGENLVKMVIEKARAIIEFLADKTNRAEEICLPRYVRKKDYRLRGGFDIPQAQTAAWHAVKEELGSLIRQLEQVNPLVIDYFLGQNPSLQEIRKIMIAWVMLECETRYSVEQGNLNRRDQLKNSPDSRDKDRADSLDCTKFNDDWCRFVIDRLAKKPKELLDNKVKFITFNYDTSLEARISSALDHTELFNKNDIKNFVNETRFLHIYGKIKNDGRYQDQTLKRISEEIFGSHERSLAGARYWESCFNAAHDASESIETIDDIDPRESKKNRLAETSEAARSAIKNASQIYILGYGFDDRNSDRLELKTLGEINSGKRIYFTNYGDKNLINKKAGRLFYKDPSIFMPPKTGIPNKSQEGTYLEKSTRNVYDALSEDFEFME